MNKLKLCIWRQNQQDLLINLMWESVREREESGSSGFRFEKWTTLTGIKADGRWKRLVKHFKRYNLNISHKFRAQKRGVVLEIWESSVKLGLRIWSQDLNQVTQVKRRWPGTEPWDSRKRSDLSSGRKTSRWRGAGMTICALLTDVVTASHVTLGIKQTLKGHLLKARHCWDDLAVVHQILTKSHYLQGRKLEQKGARCSGSQSELDMELESRW